MKAAETPQTPESRSNARKLRRAFQLLIRRFGLLAPDHTPCGHPIPVSQAHALMELLGSPGIRQLELAETLGLSKSAVSRLVEQLLRRDLIERQADDQDGRAWLLSLSAKGRQMARRIDEASLARFSTILERIPPALRGQVVLTLEVLRGAIPTEKERLKGTKP